MKKKHYIFLAVSLIFSFNVFSQSLNDIKNTKIVGVDHSNSFISFGGANADDPIYL